MTLAKSSTGNIKFGSEGTKRSKDILASTRVVPDTRVIPDKEKM
jgi:hypothetical protein